MMATKKMFIKYWILFLFLIVLIIPTKVKAKQSVTRYSISAVRIKKFKKSGSWLTITATEKFDKNGGRISKKKVRFKVAKNCKWRRKNYGIRFPENKGVIKVNYKSLRQTVYSVKGLPENGYYTLMIKVKNKRIVYVEFCSL